jgi:hypothetical protein
MKSAVPDCSDEIEVLEEDGAPWGRVRLRKKTGLFDFGSVSIPLTPDQFEEHARECLATAAKIRSRQNPTALMTQAQRALLARISQIGLAEFQSRVNRGDEDERLTDLTEMYEAYFAICRAKLGHDHVPIATWETYNMVKQRSAMVQKRSARPAPVNRCNGQYADFQGALRPCFAQEGCGLSGCPSVPGAQ